MQHVCQHKEWWQQWRHWDFIPSLLTLTPHRCMHINKCALITLDSKLLGFICQNKKCWLLQFWFPQCKMQLLGLIVVLVCSSQRFFAFFSKTNFLRTAVTWAGFDLVSLKTSLRRDRVIIFSQKKKEKPKKLGLDLIVIKVQCLKNNFCAFFQ